jgi:NAD(P)-dependent dehydrogenase (short-subunit alcohol dehydrogenase family)
MAHPNRLENAHVLVFGGTSGIGFAIASMALSNNARVTISGSRQPKVDDKVALLRSLYPSLPADRVSGYAVDLSDMEHLEANLQELFEKATNKGQKKIDHIAFSAGDALNLVQVSEISSPEQIAKGFNVRFTAPVFIAKLLLNNKDYYMPDSPHSSFTLTGGVNTKKPIPGWSIVAGSGGAQEGLMRGLAVDMKPIRVNMVEPGAIATELLAGLGEVGMERFRRFTLTGEVGRPEDAAEAYGWFMRDWFVTGTIAQTNGGRLLVDEKF